MDTKKIDKIDDLLAEYFDEYDKLCKVKLYLQMYEHKRITAGLTKQDNAKINLLIEDSTKLADKLLTISDKLIKNKITFNDSMNYWRSQNANKKI